MYPEISFPTAWVSDWDWDCRMYLQHGSGARACSEIVSTLIQLLPALLQGQEWRCCSPCRQLCGRRLLAAAAPSMTFVSQHPPAAARHCHMSCQCFRHCPGEAVRRVLVVFLSAERIGLARLCCSAIACYAAMHDDALLRVCAAVNYSAAAVSRHW